VKEVYDTETLSSMNKLASNHMTAGRFSEAVVLYKKLCEVYQRRFGAKHRDTFMAENGLSRAYIAAGRFSDAIELCQTTLKCQEEALGKEHYLTLATLNNLAAAHWGAKNIEESVPLFEQAVQRHIANFGEEHVLTLNCKANLGVNYRDAGRLNEAILCLEEAYSKGRGQEKLRWVRPALIKTYIRAGRTDKAVEFWDEQMAATRKAALPGSMQLAGGLAVHALSLLGVQAWEKAEGALRECLAIREREAPESWITFNTKSMLGEALLGRGKVEEAELLLLEGYRGMKQREQEIPPGGEMRIREAVERLVALYEALEKPEAAAQWQKLLGEGDSRQTTSVEPQDNKDRPADSNRATHESAAP
jgi:pentatricopeptide repeat protein